MGIIKKQGIQSTIIIYLGFFLGALNLLFFFPKYLSPEQIGLTRILLDFSTIFVQLSIFGLPATMLKFYPYYADYLQKKENDVLFLSILISLIGFIFVSFFLYRFRDSITEIYIEKSKLFISYFYLVYPFSFFVLIYTIIETYARNNLKSVVGNLVREVGLRLYSTILILLLALHLINFNLFIKLYSIFYLWGVIAIVAFLIWRKRMHLNFVVSKVTKRLYKKILNYGGFIYSAGFLFILSGSIDSLLISGIRGLSDGAIFTITSYFSTLIQAPQRGISGIVMPVLAKAWKDKDVKQIESIYQKTAINQMASALFLFLLIWINIDSVFKLMPNGHIYETGKYVVLFMCLTKIIDMSTGANSEILSTSNFWKFNFLTHVILVAISIPINYLFIKQFGIIGAAYSNLLAFSLYNFVRFIFLWYKFRLQPFSYKTLVCILIGIITYFVAILIPSIQNVYFNIIIKSVCICIVYGFLTYSLNVSKDITDIIKKHLNFKLIR